MKDNKFKPLEYWFTLVITLIIALLVFLVCDFIIALIIGFIVALCSYWDTLLAVDAIKWSVIILLVLQSFLAIPFIINCIKVYCEEKGDVKSGS